MAGRIALKTLNQSTVSENIVNKMPTEVNDLDIFNDSESNATGLAAAIRQPANFSPRSPPSRARISRASNRRKVSQSGFNLDSQSMERDPNDALHEQYASTAEDSDELPVIRKRRNQPAQLSSPRVYSQRQQQDLDEDLEFLGSAPDSPRLLRGEIASSKKTPKQKALEQLKRRRVRQQAEPHADQNAESEESDELEEDSDESETLPGLSAQQPDEAEDFVVEDEDDVVGEPVELPFEFSAYRTMKPRELFKFAIEWMVQKKINPAFAMEDEVYRITFQRLDHFVRGMGGSKFHSSAWTPGFSRSLNCRPILEEQQFMNNGILRDRCDACNRSGHPATWEVKFTGKTYDRDSLEEFSDEEEVDGDTDVPSADTRYYIGK